KHPHIPANTKLRVYLLCSEACTCNNFACAHDCISEPVNGSATFKCPVNENREIEFVYFQKENLFVNGHHSENRITGKWNNTKMDKNFTFYMYNLERSLSGHYKCIIMYKKAGNPDTHEYNLTVTVPYSKPSFTKECNNRNDIRSCQVTCMAQDGYPSQKIWIVLVQSGNDTNGMVTSRNDSVFNLTTKLFSSTVTAEFNCSNTEVEFVCSVGGVVSETISICSPPSNPATIIIACTVTLALLLIFAGFLIYKKCRKSKESNLTHLHCRSQYSNVKQIQSSSCVDF
uniref:Ig-like domain-containing protein n=1 Tax=Oryzias latipes TaxID=8090 RepID=A0A3P9GWY4_ORYLA